MLHSEIRIGLIGDVNPQHQAHIAIPQVLAAGGATGVWIPTDSVDANNLPADYDGLWCVPGMPYRSADGMMRVLEFARVSRKPLLATSAGFQYAVLEYARNVLGLAEADHQKTDPKCRLPLISLLDAAMLGAKARVRFVPGSCLSRAYGAEESVEQYHCAYGINNRYRRLLEGSHLMVSAIDNDGQIRAMEIDGHPFFVATLFQPELRSPSPLVNAFLGVCERRRSPAGRAVG
jgi:CTP synthase (UTP-ammonia lyase)